MRRREVYPIERHSINLYRGDYERLQELYTSRVGASKIIRDMVRAHLKKIEAEAAQRGGNLINDIEVELPNEAA